LKNALYNKGLEQSSTRSALYDFYFELFRSIKEVKLYGLQNMHLGFSKDMYKKEKKTASGITFFDSLIGILSVLPMYAGTIIVVISSFYRLANGEISLGFCLMIMMYSSLLVSPLTDFSAACSVMQANFPVLRKISKLFMTKDEDYTGQPLEKISSSIRFENLTFYYRKNSKVLDNLDLQIKFPSFICIVGKSGSGKSTIINILMKLYHNTYGRALLDNIDISAINTLDLRHIIGIVSQESFILNETLRDNIDLTGELTDERITEICKEARLDTLVGRLEGGVRAMLAENGKNISGGEKQRIILARCLAKKTEVLVLDEATSALDLVTEKEIMETICNIRKNRPMTIIAVTHRPSFAGYSDEILFLEDGKIAERGTLAELAARSERYAAFLQEEGAK
jgi:ABC-type bacteriocin/lantibiotic exporter with double-glycine peptidase domain